MDLFDIVVARKLSGGGGGGTTVEALSVTQNGTYTAPSGKAYSPVTVNVSGGSSDFSTATLTVTASNHGAIYGAPIIVAPFPDIPSFEFIGTATEPMGIGEHSVVMYKGYSAVFADYDPALSTVTTSGAIEKLLEEEGSIVYKITGDCTITIS